MKNGKVKSEVLSIRMRPGIAEVYRKLAKEKGLALDEYIETQLNPDSELAQMLKVVELALQQKATAVIEAGLQYIIGLSEVKEKSNLNDDEFIKLVSESMKEFIERKRSELKNNEVNN